MKLELSLELEIKIENEPFNINRIIKAVHLSLNEIGLSILREIIEAIDQLSAEHVAEQYPGGAGIKGTLSVFSKHQWAS